MEGEHDPELELFRLLVEQLPEPVYIVEDQRIVYMNEAFEQTLGWTRAQALGRPFTDLIAPEDLPAVLERFRRRMAGEAFQAESEYRLVLPDGQRLPVRSTARATELLGRRVNIGVVRDIRKLRATEAALAHEAAIVAAQRKALLRLTAPSIEVTEGVIVMPLIGSYDDERSARLVEDVVMAVAERRVQELFLDVTGLSLDGLSVLPSLVRIARATRLLGARTALVGISPELAARLTELELELDDITAHATLADALREHFARGA